MASLVSDVAVAGDIAAELTKVEMHGVVTLVNPVLTHVAGVTQAVQLSNALLADFKNLDSLITVKAQNIKQIAEIFRQADVTMARAAHHGSTK